MMMKPLRPTSAMACKLVGLLSALCAVHGPALGQEMQPSQAPAPRGDTSYGPVNRDENLVQLEQKMKSAKAEIEDRQQQLLEQRYDLSNSAAAGVTMSGGKPLQDAVRVKLPSGMTWDKLATMSPDKIRSRDMFSQEISSHASPESTGRRDGLSTF